MQLLFAPRRDQPVSRENLQNLVRRVFFRPRGAARPENRSSRSPARPAQPASRRSIAVDDELTRTSEAEPRMHRQRQPRTDPPETVQASEPGRRLVEHFDRLVPCRCLRRLISPRQSTCRWTTRPSSRRLFATMFQSVLLFFLRSCVAEHDAVNLSARCCAWELGRSSVQPFWLKLKPRSSQINHSAVEKFNPRFESESAKTG